ncbi:MAG TPA: hypothetical protein VMZ92_12055 [Planctomycetota bacterium]|nr:hypothetical protein [Planctomycetota bacterium]
MEPLRDRALAFLESLRADAALIPGALRPWWLEYHQGHIPRYLDTLEFMDRHGLGGKMLEVGSVPGHFTVPLKNLGCDVRGVDPDPSRITRFLAKYDVPVDCVDRLLFLFGRDYQGDPVQEFSLMEKVGHMGHVRLYSADEAQRFLRHVGFEVVTVAYRGSIRGGWKGKVLRLLDPKRERWREYVFLLARKGATA